MYLEMKKLTDYILKETKGETSNFDIYRNNFILTHVKQLKEVYPCVVAILGEKNFSFLGKKFLYSHYPNEQDLNLYGNSFDSFLLKCSELNHISYISFLALLDKSFYLQEATSLELPRGVYTLWKSIREGTVINNIEIDEDEIEIIKFE